MSRWPAAALVAALSLLAACGSGGGTTERADDAPGTTRAPSGSVDAGAADPADSGPPLRLALVGVVGTDPATASPASPSATIVADLLHDTLTALGDDGAPAPGLADFVPAEGGRVWRFTLRSDATFADGSPIEAADVTATLERVRGLGGSSLAAIALEDVRSVTAVDARTVDVTLAAPSAVLPELLSAPAFGVIDRELVPGAPGAPLNPSGDHRIVEAGPERIVLQRRAGGGPERIVVRLMGSEAAAADAFAAGEVDWAPVPVERLGELGVRPEQLPLFHATILLGANPNVEPLVRPGVRQAIALAVDRAAIAAAVLGPTARPADGLVPAGVVGAPTSCVGPCGPDLDASRRLLAEAFPTGDMPPVQLLVDRTAVHDAIAGVLVDQLAAAGVTVSVQAADEAAYSAAVGAGQVQLHLASSLGLGRSPAVHLLPWSSASPDNTTRYRNDLVDLALGAAVAEPDLAVRTARWAEVHAAILADAPVVPLVQLRTVAAISPRARGLVVRADGSIDVSGVPAR